MLASVCLSIYHISSDEEAVAAISDASIRGLRQFMTLIPMAVLVVGLIIFWRKYKLNDNKLAEIDTELKKRRGEKTA